MIKSTYLVCRIMLLVTLALLVLLFSINLISSAIIIESPPKDSYNLGNKIDVDITVNFETEKKVIVSSDISCSNLNYFKTPLDFDTDDNHINIPSLTVDKNFLGTCKLIFNVLNLNGQILEQTNSNEFSVTDILLLNFSTDKDTYLPGESVLIEGKIEKGVTIKILLKDNEQEINSFSDTLSNNFFSVVFKLADNLKGEKKIFIEAEDKHGNKASDTKKIEVLQVPRTIKIELEKSQIMPYENLTLNSKIYDQSDELMDLNVTYRIFDPQNNLIESDTSKNIILSLKNPIPGDYIVKASYNELEDIKKFSVLEFRKIDIKIESGLLTITNTGNVRYIDEMTINATIEGVVYQFPISINLAPNQQAFIDLKKELPSENYDLTIYSKNESYYLDDVKIDDNRPLIKKLSQGISKITGSTIIPTTEVGNVFYLGFFIVFIGFLITFLVHRGFKKKIGEVSKVVDTTVKVQKKQIGGLEKEKAKIKNLFGSYVDPHLLKKDFSSDIRKKDISVLFTDIRGFAKIFDKKDSQEVANMLNLYFSKSTEIIKKNNGFINKFIGDSVMALFNAVADDDRHLTNAIKSAIEIKKQMSLINNELTKNGSEPISVGIGIDSGRCTIGSIGSKDKLEYTAVGVPVNIAFRLQSISDGNILITEIIYNKIKNYVNSAYFGDFDMKNIGKIRVYKILDDNF